MSVDVEIWCASGADTERGRWLYAFIAWEGTLPAAPQVGDIMCVFKDCDGKKVTEVAWRIPEKILRVWVEPDFTDEWTEALGKELP